MTTSDITLVLAGGLPIVQRSLASLCRGRMRVDHGAFPDDMELEDGYPNDARVDEIACVSIRDANRWLREVFPHAINALPCGHAEVYATTDDFGRSILRITVVTGGWSGCESIIGAVVDHTIMRMCLVERRRGGWYMLEVPAVDAD